jgi:D-beta-D-heptose 7-phosphate kinase/D-beta-D-heptose 1-phosphate adenosyltransferase
MIPVSRCYPPTLPPNSAPPMSDLLATLSRWRPFTAVVVGDFMLDELVYGNADRMSPEAPVPVLHVQRTEERSGGASNVCLNLAAMRGQVRAIGVTGADASAAALRRLLGEAGVDTAGLVEDPSRPTTVKRSLIGLAQHRHPQKMFRVDYESRQPLEDAQRAALIAAFERALDGADVVCLEDYNKGVCCEAVCRAVIERARARGVPVFTDPAAIRDYAKYRGCTVMTPNRIEAAAATGIKPEDDAAPEAHAPAAERLVRDLDLEAAVITLDKQGALLLERGGVAQIVPTMARQVYDVSGAGDMVLAALAAGRANGMSWHDAVRFANAAAGLEVEVFGCVPIPIEQIHREVLVRERTRGGAADLGEVGGASGKLRTLEELQVEVAALRRAGKTIVFTNGCFDILHAGHLSLLRRAAALGDFLIVAINSDESVRRLKGPERPVYTQQDRAELLGGLACVDAIVIFHEDTEVPTVKAVRPDVLVKGGEYTIDRVPAAEFVLSTGGRVELLPMVDGRSTTKTVDRIRSKA